MTFHQRFLAALSLRMLDDTRPLTESDVLAVLDQAQGPTAKAPHPGSLRVPATVPRGPFWSGGQR